MTPRIHWQGAQGSIDYRKAPLQPYYPSNDKIANATAFGSREILEVPVTVQPRFLRRNPHWFRPWFSDVKTMKAIAKYHLKTYQQESVVNLNMMFQSMEVIEKASPYPQSRADVNLFLDNMHAVLSWCRDEGFEFAGLSDLHSIYSQ